MLSAFKSFGESIDQLGAQRAISQANDNVDLIRNSELDDAKKQQAMQDNARRLAGQLTGFGGSASGTQQLYNAFAPAKPAMPQNDVEAAYQFRNDPKALKQYTDARKQILDVTDPVEEDSIDPAKQARADATKQNLFSKFDDKLNPDEKSRSASGTLAQNLNVAKSIQALAGNDTKMEALNKLPKQQLFEMSSGVVRMVKQGMGTEADLHMAFPATANMSLKDAITYATNNPVPADAGAFANLYLNTAQREAQVAQQTIAENILSKAPGNFQLYNMDPVQFKQTVAAKLRAKAGMDVTAADIIVDAKNKTVTTAQQQEIDNNIHIYTQAAKEAKLAMKSGDPKSRAKAQKFFDEVVGLDADAPLLQINTAIGMKARTGAFGSGQ